MTPNHVGYKELYELIDRKFSHLHERIDEMGRELQRLENWRENLMGKITIISAVVSVIFAAVIKILLEKTHL